MPLACINVEMTTEPRKGVGLLVQNARRWPHNLLCIDPKGENAMLSWQAREARGQKVAILDPFYQIPKGSIPDRLRLRINPLASIDPATPRARAQILALGNGMIVNHDPKHMEWTDTARKITAGIIAWVVTDAPPSYRTLERVRHVLRQTREELYEDAQRMAAHNGLGGLVRQAGNIMISAMTGKDGVEKGALALAQRATSWLDDDAIAGVLSEPEGGQASFAMEDLKTAPASLFLVLPPDYVMDYSGFLRLFVKAALSAMGAPVTNGRECLFLLDEFYSLGKLDELTEAAGRMRSYGVHLWPFMQSLTQLTSLYGREGAQTFLVNAAAHIFLGNDQDSDALEHISRRLGVTNSKDIGELYLPDGSHIASYAYGANRSFSPSPRDPKTGLPTLWGVIADSIAESALASAKADYQNAERRHREQVERARAEYDHRRAAIGTRRLEPQEIAQLVGKGEGEKLARSMIVFMSGGKVLNLNVAPFFEDEAHAARAAQVALAQQIAYHQEITEKEERERSQEEARQNRQAWQDFNEDAAAYASGKITIQEVRIPRKHAPFEPLTVYAPDYWPKIVAALPTMFAVYWIIKLAILWVVWVTGRYYLGFEPSSWFPIGGAIIAGVCAWQLIESHQRADFDREAARRREEYGAQELLKSKMERLRDAETNASTERVKTGELPRLPDLNIDISDYPPLDRMVGERGSKRQQMETREA